ncbi:hypothetical protein C8R43DRAFT_1132092 [Mycena crocata]|nr:hypothetical protein C8R43DRAFT_1132092 [Mycena crocata]
MDLPPQPESVGAKLPPELERPIFEMAAYRNLPAIRDLMLVAGRVKTWVEPILYRVIFLGGEPINGLPSFTVKSLLYLIDHNRKQILANTRHLVIQDPQPGVSPSHLKRLNAIMGACTGVTHLFLHSNKNLQAHELAALGGMPALRVLAVHFSKLFHRVPVDFGHAVFRNLTHLELRDTENDGAPWGQIMSGIPHLTHLAFSEMWVFPQLVGALRECSRMEALVFLCATQQAMLVVGRQSEVRFVTVMIGNSNTNWQRGGLSERDYWKAADKFITERREGTIDGER